MTRKTELHGWDIPVSYKVSSEDTDKWGGDEGLTRFFDEQLDEEVILRGTLPERPADGAYPGLLYLQEDASPKELQWDNGSTFETIASLDAETLDGLDSTQFLRADQADSLGGTLDLANNDLVDGAATVWDGTNDYVPDAAVQQASLDAATLDGVDSADFAQLAQPETVSASWTFSSEQVFNGGIAGTLTGGTSLTDITGENLSIVGGALTAAAGGNVITTGTVTLSGGQATIGTGVTQPVYPALDPSNGNTNTQDIDVVASVRYDNTAGENVIEITEDSTAVGNPTIAYDILGV